MARVSCVGAEARRIGVHRGEAQIPLEGAAQAGINGAIVGGIAGGTFGLGTAALGVAEVSATSAEAWGLAAAAGPVASLGGILFKASTGQPIGASDAVGAIASMVPLPSKVGVQIV